MQTKRVASIIWLALITYPVTSQCSQPVWSQEWPIRLVSQTVASSESESPPLLRGIESDTFTNKPTQPSKSTDSKPESAPGADAMMTPDWLFVSPTEQAGSKPPPLQAFVGQSLTLTLKHSDIVLDDLQGVSVLVVNDTNRPLVLDGDNARAIGASASYKCAPLVTVQKSVLPIRGGRAMAKGVFTKVLPAAATVGLEPTVKDAIRMKKPVRMRYGPDEMRRMAEASRFGSRIVWPHQKTNGIVYFDAGVPLSGVKIEIPVQTLFDPADKTLLSGLLQAQ
jgi:hypothetical protein